MKLNEMISTIPVKPYFRTDLGVLYNADCLEIMQYIPEKYFDLILTDPPYEKEAHTKQRRTRSALENRKKVLETSCNFEPINENTRNAIIDYSLKLCVGWSLVFCQAEAVGKYYELSAKHWRRAMIWVKPDGLPQMSGDKPAMGYESICAIWCEDGRSYWNGGGQKGVFRYNCTDYKHEHLTQKPIKLIRKLISLFSRYKNDVIFDPFFGSGTLGVACEQMKKLWIGIEISEKYCAIAKERIEHESNQGKFDFGVSNNTNDTEHRSQPSLFE